MIGDAIKFVISTTAGAVIGGAVTYFFVERHEIARRKVSKRADHLDQIKEEVLRPVWTMLRDHYLPICRLQSPALFLEVRTVQRPASRVTDDPFEKTVFEFAIRVPMVGLSKRSFAEAVATISNTLLYRDVRENHFGMLMLEWENFKTDCDKQFALILEKAQAIGGILKSNFDLPAYYPSAPYQEYHISYEKLANFLLERNLGINGHYLRVEKARLGAGTDCKFLIKESGTGEELCAVPDEKLAEDIAQIGTTIFNRAELDEIRNMFAALARRGAVLTEKFDSAILNENLPLSCSLLWDSARR